jgi:hypothetical protein
MKANRFEALLSALACNKCGGHDKLRKLYNCPEEYTNYFWGVGPTRNMPLLQHVESNAKRRRVKSRWKATVDVSKTDPCKVVIPDRSSVKCQKSGRFCFGYVQTATEPNFFVACQRSHLQELPKVYSVFHRRCKNSLRFSAT